MAKKKYRLKILPLFESDLSEAVDYITYKYIPVKNFFVFYVVIGDVMEVRRFLYASRDIEQHI